MRKRHQSRLTALAAAIAIVLALLFGINPGQAEAGQVALAWDANTEPDLSGYNLYYGTTSRTYGAPINVGRVLSYTITGLTDGRTYYFAVTATDTFGNESGYSNEVVYTIPSAPGIPEINLVGNSVSIVDGDATPSAADFTDFGSVDVASGTLTRTFTIRNTGTAALTLSGSPLVALGGTNAADFTVTVLPVSPVAAAGNTTFQVRFDPAAVGARSATLSIANSDANENPYNFTIQGTGTAVTVPEIDLLGNSASIVDGDTTPSTADFTDFGSTDIAGGEVMRTFTIRNTGSGPLTLSGSPKVVLGGANAGDFTVVTQPVSPVAAGWSTIFQVRFDPSAAGTRVATLTIANNDADENPYDFVVRGAGTTAPEIELLSNDVRIDNGATATPGGTTDFGVADVATDTVTRTFTLRNTGSLGLNLSGRPRVKVGGAHAGDFAVVTQPVSPVAAGWSTIFQVRFDPSAAGTRTAILTIPNSDADESPYTFAVQGTGRSPEIDVAGNGVSIPDGDTSPAASDLTDFGLAGVSTGTVTRTFTIQNSGTGPLNLTGSPLVAVSGANAADFAVTALPASPVAANGNTTFQVRFDPSAAGRRVATVTVASSDVNENPYTFVIQGTGTAPEINLTGNAASILSGDTAPSTADHTDFGLTDIVAGSVVRTFTIRNTGTEALLLPGSPRVAIGGLDAGDFAVTVPPPASVEAGASATFQVMFNPGALGTRATTLSIANSDPDENPYTFAIRGTGANAPEINVTGNAVGITDGDTTPGTEDHTDFGSTPIAGGSVVRTFTILNEGTATLSLASRLPVAVGGANASDFKVTVKPPSSVAAGGSATFEVRFDPNGPGTRAATITIACNDSDEGRYDFAVRGVGMTAPEIVLLGNSNGIADGDTTPAASDFTDFGKASIGGGSVTRTFSIKNAGTEPLILSGTPLVSISGGNAADFTVTTLPGTPVAVAKSTSFQVRFSPQAAGTRVATISIASDDTDENPYDFVIAGTGTAPEINVAGNGVSIADGDGTPSGADLTDFGATAVSGGTVTRTFSILNAGAATLALTGSPRVLIGGTHAADFAVTTQPASPVAPAGSTRFSVRFDPQAAGVRVATLSIANSDTDESLYDFAIQGTGSAAAADALADVTVTETLSRPATPSGPTILSAGVTYTYSTGGAVSSNGDAVQYRFSWSDGTASGWLPVGVREATKSWLATGTYTQVHVQARCASHTSAVSAVSSPLTVVVGPATVAETVTRPGVPLGPSSLSTLTTSRFRAGGALSSSGDALQYRFLWSDGTASEWLAAGVLETDKSWGVPGSYEVRTEARCSRHPSIVSSPSEPLTVTVSPGVAENISEPTPPTGPSDGQTGFLYAFDAGGASVSTGDLVQYRFQWGDGTTSDWVAADDAAQTRAWKFWTVPGIYSVTAEARCATHPGLTIASSTFEVRIALGDPELFFDPFTVGAAGADSAWQVVSGEWVVRPDETFSPASPQQDSLALIGTVPGFTTGRLTARLRLAGGSTNYSAGIIFAYTDSGHYRYVALTESDLYVGQVGETAAESEGVKARVQVPVALDTWHQVRVDVHPDGEVRVHLGGSEQPDVSYRFGDPAGGQVGCSANVTEVSFDDFGIWDERVLLP